MNNEYKKQTEQQEQTTDLQKYAKSSLLNIFNEFEVEVSGLRNSEAYKRLQSFGANQIPRVIKYLFFKRFIEQFKNLFNILLFAAAFLSIISGVIYKDQNSINMGYIIIGVVFLSIFFSLYQEYRAEKAVSELKIFIPNQVKVVRNRKLVQISSDNIVPGDILLLQEGDKVPADIRLITSNTLSVDNSILTGESEPQFKDALKRISKLEKDVLDFQNLVLAGSSVISGKGRGIVLATGKYTQFARVVELIDETEKDISPIQKEVNRTAKINVFVAIGIGFIFLFIVLIILHLDLLDSILFMIGVSLSLVPEGLQVTITLSLALSAVYLVRKNVLIKQLSTIHTLGSITVICTDKTGTITQNQMMVEKIWFPGMVYTITGEGFRPTGQIIYKNNVIKNNFDVPELIRLGECCIANTNSSISPPEDQYNNRWRALGDTTDAACLVLGLKMGLTIEDTSHKYPLLKVFPFDYNRRITTSIHKYEETKIMIFTKGALESILSRSAFIYSNNKIISMNQELSNEILRNSEQMAKEGYRIIAFGEKTEENIPLSLDRNTIETAFIFLGIAGILDPPRHGVSKAVVQARKAGIKLIMITGDNELTAESIARKAEIIQSTDPVILSGSKVSSLNDKELTAILDNPEIICARMNPEQKLRIVSLLKQKKEIVAVTGDGVNDVPALHAADVGVAMGLAGTQAAIEASQMVLLDDNFATIVKGIEGGRSIMDNLKKFMKYVFTHNWAQLVGFLVFMLWDIPIPISVIIILSIDLIMEIPPSFALILEPPESETLNRPPQKDSHLFNLTIFLQSMYIGLIIGIYSLYKAMQAYSQGGWVFGMATVPDPHAYSRGITLFLVGIMAGQLGNLLATRSYNESAFNRKFFHNKWIFIAIGIELCILFAIVYVPILQIIFNTTALSILDMLEMFLLTIIIFFIEEARKFIMKKYNYKN